MKEIENETMSQRARRIIAVRRAAYNRAYEDAQAGRMNNDESHEFATDQADRAGQRVGGAK